MCRYPPSDNPSAGANCMTMHVTRTLPFGVRIRLHLIRPDGGSHHRVTMAT